MSRCAGFFLLILLLLPTLSAGLELPPPLPALTPGDQAQIDLGRMLFFDRRLSGDGTMSCAVCHLPDLAFSDGRAISGAYPTNKHWRNTPSLLNAAALQTFFWDGRSDSLIHQVRGPIESPFEMNADLGFTSAKLAEIPAYASLFRKIYAAEVSPALILKALVAFEQSLQVSDSPFDRYLSGNKQALGVAAREGLEIFFGPRGGCSQCHNGPLLSDQKFYNLGVGETEILLQDAQHRTTRRYLLARQGLPMQETDPGRYLVSRDGDDMGAFRTPPLRQVAQTGPYMHNGKFKTLAAVVAFLSRGGGDDSHKTTQLRKLGLNSAEQAALVVFLESLSGTVPEVHRPHLPGD